jgi:hypothetical protein
LIFFFDFVGFIKTYSSSESPRRAYAGYTWFHRPILGMAIGPMADIVHAIDEPQ